MRNIILIASALLCTELSAQYFHKTYYTNPIQGHDQFNGGLKTVFNTGDYFAATGVIATTTNQRPRLVTTNADGTPLVNVGYDFHKPNVPSVLYNVIGKSIAEYNGGYIIVGNVRDNSNITVPGGSDIFIMKVSTQGAVVAYKELDIQSQADYANYIVRSATAGYYYLCGESKRCKQQLRCYGHENRCEPECCMDKNS